MSNQRADKRTPPTLTPLLLAIREFNDRQEVARQPQRVILTERGLPWQRNLIRWGSSSDADRDKIYRLRIRQSSTPSHLSTYFFDFEATQFKNGPQNTSQKDLHTASTMETQTGCLTPEDSMSAGCTVHRPPQNQSTLECEASSTRDRKSMEKRTFER
ncbi:hypothetical protein BJ508DRAFT_330544 [Ascobolus immersus RN42]|uniref:Uncharacterized protein n=1 Tax=Ascobolus immersus RN42 TaxID=1160509 RepID=A0A3N4HVJ9_ASCIM|nr:hypothetical protein BJ508DRAFT_330544 [Ascobolus immersus RN42]